MDKEEIIIDGVDVSGCENYSPLEYLQTNNGYDEHPDYCGNYIDHICVNHSNCYYKQFKRIQNALQEIKTLVTTDYIQIKKQLVQNYDCLDNFMQKIEDKCNEVNQ